MVVRSSSEIGYRFGMSETLVGLTIVAIGTGLPEIVISITAARKKENELALGNIVGSNVFNIFFILGATSLITPLEVDREVVVDLILLVLFTVTLLVFFRERVLALGAMKDWL